MSEVCSAHGKDEKYVPNIIRKPEGKKSLGRHRVRLKNDFKIGLNEIE
jgi:hypothetical protein